MRNFIRILIWSLIAVVIEVAGISYLDRTYSKPVDTYSEVESTPKKEKKTYNDVKLPENASDVKVSYDGKYVSYYEDEVLKIVNTMDESNSSVETTNNAVICYSKWLPDSNLLLLCEKDKKNKISFYSYDAGKSSKKELIDHDLKPLKIETNSKNDTVDKITLSTANHVMYVKILHKDKTSDLHKINVMNQVEEMKTSSNMIGNISMLRNDTNLIYEDLENEEIKNFTTTKTTVKVNKKVQEKDVVRNSSIQFEDDDKKVLLGTDDEDRVYVATTRNGKVDKVLFGDLKNSTDQWKTLKLLEATDRKNVIVTKVGDVYIKDDAKGVLKNIVSNNETKYDGNFIEIQDKYVFTLSNNKVIRSLLK